MATKDAYVKKIKSQFKNLDGALGELRDRALQAGTDLRDQVADQWQNLSDRLEGLETKLDELQDAGEDAWESVRAEMRDAWRDFRKAADQLVARLR